MHRKASSELLKEYNRQSVTVKEIMELPECLYGTHFKGKVSKQTKDITIAHVYMRITEEELGVKYNVSAMAIHKSVKRVLKAVLKAREEVTSGDST